MILVKSDQGIVKMKKAGQVTARVIEQISSMVKPGVTTRELDKKAEELCLALGGKPAFKGYRGFAYSLCCSPNEQVVHGFPTSVPLEEGDILSLDFGALVDGYFGDMAVTLPVGEISEEAKNLLAATKASLEAGIAQVIAGARLGDISAAIQKCAEGAGYSIVKQFVGHGIGQALHEEPSVPNFGVKGKGPKLKAGYVLAIEPMVNMGKQEVKILPDGWTTSTIDGKLSAHFEHTVAVTKKGPMVLTLP